MPARTCPGCLTEYPPDKRFCAACGIDLETGLEILTPELSPRGRRLEALDVRPEALELSAPKAQGSPDVLPLPETALELVDAPTSRRRQRWGSLLGPSSEEALELPDAPSSSGEALELLGAPPSLEEAIELLDAPTSHRRTLGESLAAPSSGEALELLDAPPERETRESPDASPLPLELAPPKDPDDLRLEFGEPGARGESDLVDTSNLTDPTRLRCPSCNVIFPGGIALCPTCGVKPEPLRALPPGETWFRQRLRTEMESEGAGPEGWRKSLWHLAKVFAPGLFRPKSLIAAALFLIPALVTTGMALSVPGAMAHGPILSAAAIMFTACIGAIALFCYVQAVVIIQTGELAFFPVALADYRRAHWMVFSVAMTILFFAYCLLYLTLKLVAG